MRNKLFSFAVLFVLLLTCDGLYAQRRNTNDRHNQVQGVVLVENDEAAIGASVMVVGTTVGVAADIDGTFSIPAGPRDTLLVSYVGYADQKVPVDGRDFISIQLEMDEELSEVVVIGYGTTRAKNFTGSVDVVRMSDSPASDLGLTSAADLIRGRLSGLVMGAESGTVGSSSSLLIRGRKSVNSTSEEPLIILNGVIFAGGLDDIDPNSIESISVLKDATSLAAYGSRAAQGVVMVTTKKGAQGKPRINFSTSHEISGPSFRPEYLDGAGYIRYRNAKTKQEDLNYIGWMTPIEKANYDKGIETDWYDLSTRTGYSQNYNLNFSGATETLNYYVGGRHSNQRGMTVGNDFIRNNLTVNVSSKIASWLEVGVNMNYSNTASDGVSAFLGSANQTPYGSAKLPNGEWRKYVECADVTAVNPVWSTYNGVDVERRSSTLVLGGFLSLDIPWIKGLNYRMNVSHTQRNSSNKEFFHESNEPTLIAGDIDGLGYTQPYLQLGMANGSISSSVSVNWVIDNILSYTQTFGNHYLSASLVYTRDSAQSSRESYEGSDFTSAGNTLLGWHGLANASTKNFTSPTYSLHTDVGYLARLIYSFKDTYHLNASIRRDGSSVFGNDNKWGYFPAVGAAWTISNEPWMSDITWLDDLKLKLSWGKNGAQTISPYGTLSKVDMSNAGGIANYYGGTIHWGQQISTLGNAQLGWQTTDSWNAGFETDIIKRRIHFELNGYKSKTTDQIFDRSIPVMTAGIGKQKATMGRVDNWGIEANLSSTNIRTKEFSWTSDVIFTLNRNKLVDLYGDGKDDIASGLFIGHSLGAIYGYRTEGIFQEGPNAGEPIYYTKDGEQTSNPAASDRQILGYSVENFRTSFSNTFRYKNFQLYIMIQGIFGGNGYGMGNNTFAYETYNTQNRSNAFNIPFWTKDNPSNEYPSPAYKNSSRFYSVYNSYSHIRLQDVSLSYDITPVLKPYGFANAKVAVSGRNLLFWAPYWRFGDPGTQSSTMGSPRAVTFSLNLTF